MQPLAMYLYLNEIDVPLTELRAYLQRPGHQQEYILNYLDEHFKGGGAWENGAPVFEVRGEETPPATVEGGGAYVQQAGTSSAAPMEEAADTGEAASAASSTSGAQPNDVQFSFVDIMQSMNPGYLPVVPIKREVHQVVSDYVTSNQRPPMSTLSWTIVKILTGHCNQDQYDHFVAEARKISQEIMSTYVHIEISKHLTFLLRHKLPKEYEYLTGQLWYPLDHLLKYSPLEVQALWTSAVLVRCPVQRQVAVRALGEARHKWEPRSSHSCGPGAQWSAGRPSSDGDEHGESEWRAA